MAAGIFYILTSTLCLLLLQLRFETAHGRYQPNWKSIDSRPLPAWYDKAKVGIFIHWGVFSVPSFGDGEAAFMEHYTKGKYKRKSYVDFMKKNYRPGFTYDDFAAQFTAEFYDANTWARHIPGVWS